MTPEITRKPHKIPENPRKLEQLSPPMSVQQCHGTCAWHLLQSVIVSSQSRRPTLAHSRNLPAFALSAPALRERSRFHPLGTRTSILLSAAALREPPRFHLLGTHTSGLLSAPALREPPCFPPLGTRTFVLSGRLELRIENPSAPPLAAAPRVP
jgi:hypothetical protein